MVQLADDLNRGIVQAVLFYQSNPVYSSPLGESLDKGIRKAKLSVSFAGTADETSMACQFIAPDNHYLESWNDGEPVKGMYHFTQPVISEVFNTRQAQTSLLTWAGMVARPEKDPFASKGIYSQKHSASPYYLYIRSKWAALGLSSDDQFNKVLHDGVYSANRLSPGIPALMISMSALGAELEKSVGRSNEPELVLYQNIAVRDGSLSNNPWLQETPDPLSKVTWDNYVSLPKALAQQKGIEMGDLVNISAGNTTLKAMPVYIQPGQANNTVGIAVGYGRMGKTGEKGVFEPIGKNAYPFMLIHNGTYSNVSQNVKIEKVSGKYELAVTQTNHSIEGRDIIRETTLEDIKKDARAGNNKAAPHLYTLWETRDYRKDGAPNHHWAMSPVQVVRLA
jgi:molybdopterin-containing oxidoreductase family iron-sulfur binding subunit